MKTNWKNRFTGYALILVLPALLAAWIWYTPAYLKELKRIEPVVDNLDNPMSFVDGMVDALAKKDRRQLYDMMLNKDGTEYNRIYSGLMEDGDIRPLDFLGAGRMVHTHQKDAITLYYRSRTNGKNYLFGLVMQSNGIYKVRTISSFNKLPDKLGVSK